MPTIFAAFRLLLAAGTRALNPYGIFGFIFPSLPKLPVALIARTTLVWASYSTATTVVVAFSKLAGRRLPVDSH